MKHSVGDIIIVDDERYRIEISKGNDVDLYLQPIDENGEDMGTGEIL